MNPCRLPGVRIMPHTDDTRRVECPNCGRIKVQDVNEKKARCPVCGNVWAWQKRRSGIVRLLRRAG